MNNQPPIHERITDIIRAYYQIPADYADIDRGVALQKKLVVLLFGLAREVGELYTERNGAEYRRKSTFAAKRAEYIQAGESVAKAESRAEVDTDELRKEESQADAAYHSMRLIYDAAKLVAETMRQQVSNMKHEYAAQTALNQ